MSLILCRHEPVRQPLYIDALGICLYSSQELCYVIVNHPFLVMDDFFRAPVVEFIRRDLDLPYLAARVEKAVGEGSSDDALIFVLQECGYYTQEEISAFAQKLTALRKLPLARYLKEKADYYFQNGHYGTAISLYERALAMPKEALPGDWFTGTVWNNLAAAYTNMFYFEKAMQAYERACDKTGDENVLKRMYFLKKLQPGLVMRERYRAAVTKENQERWDREYRQAFTDVLESDEIEKIDDMFEAAEPKKRIEQAAEQVACWKKEYRKMV
ncbi:MAG: tetratricopeptide repeat protein [bacterium]|nr:tetratricopeptide repeat protein [bacterium]